MILFEKLASWRKKKLFENYQVYYSLIIGLGGVGGEGSD